MNGKILVRILRQFNASFSGADSRFGKAGLCLSANRREVRTRMSVSRFWRDASRVLRMSFGEKRENTSSVDSGSCQNWEDQLEF